jgi:hypothetical protein
MSHKYKSRAGVNVTHTGITWAITLGRGGRAEGKIDHKYKEISFKKDSNLERWGRLV